MATERCPRCGSDKLTAGVIAPGRAGMVMGQVRVAFAFFIPTLRWWSFPTQPGVRLQDTACLSCGFIWSSTAPEELQAFIERHGTVEAKARLAAPVQSGSEPPPA